MIIQNPLLTGSLNYNGADLSNVTSSNANSASVSLVLTAVSSSNQQLSASYIALSGSYNVFSGSASTRVTQIENTYATTGSNSFRADQSITGSLVVSSTITAQTLVVQTVTSSIVYSSGSNLFGNALANTQTFTGSVNITGSLAIAGNITSNGTAVMLGTGSANYLPKFTAASTIGNSQIFDNGTNVGINQPSPTRTLDILGASGIGTVLKLQGASGTTTYLQLAYNGATNAQSGYIGYNSSGQMQFFTNDTVALTIDSNRNLGLGVTPSAWYTGYTALQVGFSGAIFSNRTSADTNITMIGNNAFLNSGATNWIYQNTGFATRYTQVSGGHEFYTAASGTAGNAITFTQAMTLTAAGNLGIGTTSPSQKLEVVGGEIKAGRIDSSNEGGQLSFGRASDNNTAWYIDAYGSAASPQLRFVNVDNAVVAMTITGSSVGIGTSSPLGKLDISTGGNRNVVISNDSTDTGYNIVSLNGSRTKGAYAGIAGGGTADNNLYLNSGVDIVFQNGASFTQRMRTVNEFTLAGGPGGTGGPTQVIGTTSMCGILFVSIGTQNCAAIFIINAGNPPVLVSQSTSETRFSITYNSGNTANVYVSGTNIELQNNIQATRAFYCQFFGKLS
jgi:hypothetical protein